MDPYNAYHIRLPGKHMVSGKRAEGNVIGFQYKLIPKLHYLWRKKRSADNID